MSKLAHSNDETMRIIERNNLINHEGWARCVRCGGSGKMYTPDSNINPFRACPACDGFGATEN